MPLDGIRRRAYTVTTDGPACAAAAASSSEYFAIPEAAISASLPVLLLYDFIMSQYSGSQISRMARFCPDDRLGIQRSSIALWLRLEFTYVCYHFYDLLILCTGLGLSVR